jgi:hypothetical protein
MDGSERFLEWERLSGVPTEAQEVDLVNSGEMLLCRARAIGRRIQERVRAALEADGQQDATPDGGPRTEELHAGRNGQGGRASIPNSSAALPPATRGPG